jgi:glycosyltransferase involved in cell wall biosynthesis
VLEVNAPLIQEQQRYRSLWNVPRAELLLIQNAGTADVVACVSSSIARWVTGHVPGAKTFVIPNGVNVQRVTPRRTGQHRPDCLTVAFVGTLKPWHGVPGLLEAAALANASTPDPALRWAVRIVGDGPERDGLEELARKLKVDVEFTGAVPPADVPELLGQCDAAAAPYPAAGQDDYFSPLKVYEYMAAAMPIIATNVGQLPSILQNGMTGLLVRAGDPSAFAEALIALGRSPVLRGYLGANARAAAVRHFSWDTVLGRIIETTNASRTVAAL